MLHRQSNIILSPSYYCEVGTIIIPLLKIEEAEAQNKNCKSGHDEMGFELKQSHPQPIFLNLNSVLKMK